MPNFFKPAKFVEPISSKLCSVNTKIGESVIPYFRTKKKHESLPYQILADFPRPWNLNFGKLGSVTTDSENLNIIFINQVII